MPEPTLKRKKSQEHLEYDLAQLLKVKNIQGFIKAHVANYDRNDLTKLQDLYNSAQSEQEYQEMIERLADKLTQKVEGGFPKTFEQTVNIVEEEEKEIVKGRQKQNASNSGPANGSTDAPSTHPNPPTPTTSGGQASVPASSTGEQGQGNPAGPAGQTTPTAPGNTSTPPNPGHDQTTNPQNQANPSGSTNPHVSPPSGGTPSPSIPANNRATGSSPQSGPSPPANQSASPNTGDTPKPGHADSQIPSNKLPRNDTMSTNVETVFSNDGKSSKSSETSAGSSVHGNNGAQEPDTTHRLPPQEDLEQEYAAYAEEFIRRNFKGLLDPNTPNFKEMMRTAARKAKDIMKKYDITPEDAKKVTKLALYDFAILCDDSSSMMPYGNEKMEDRVTPLKDTLGRISEMATIIEPSGVSLRFLNYENDWCGWDNMKSRDVIYRRFVEVEDIWGGWTQLGTVLDQKIIQPMVMDKVRNGTFVKPLIVVVITDGQPFGEREDAFKEAVLRCKRSREVVGYGEASVIFIISRVGSDENAHAFLSGLKRSKELREWVYCNMDRLDDNSAIMQRAAIVGEAQNDKDYAKKLLQVFLAALGQQTK
ncbi:hypothetical protein TWF102_001664 [Orbilia oligospora]|uniref:VWFA domain-containing protein n=1 Tax=Orbilia oligospora TaxID=2813651 RepID=A0A7C8J129_ORBOL|nr:hypothetical protein TWF103_003914 [Orbilia oligospora]KAF3081445.1 hypothetical protein TWF102_001664 [Orbilia oligospora]KAF3109595.1 hypothetical protein TWF706_001452 [Orbilia oligospora]KAF3138772.1 hypothetical protein TWF594_006954 [Orbilia oligospora]